MSEEQEIALLSQEIDGLLQSVPIEIAAYALAESAKNLAKDDDELSFVDEAFNEVFNGQDD